jgi:hypothetical protein
MAETDLNNPVFEPSQYDEKELLLLEIFQRIDVHLVNILIGIARVLADELNPERFHQAAHSIREIIGILVRKEKNNIQSHQAEEQNEEAFTILDSSFDECLELMPASQHLTDRKSQCERIKGKYKDLKKVLRIGELTVPQAMRRYYATDEDLVRLPKYARENIISSVKALNEINEYYVSVAHHGSDGYDPKIFMNNWLLIKDKLLDALSPIFKKDIPIIDEVIAEEYPPNE